MSALPTLFAENDASLPVQERLVRTVRDAILAGHLPQGSRLPPSRVLARDLSLSRGTVEQAYGRLEAEGYLTRRVGVGSFVALAVAPPCPGAGRRSSPAAPVRRRRAPRTVLPAVRAIRSPFPASCGGDCCSSSGAGTGRA
jgi:GntR family transcriptional regulator/MocR family aminotransferase